MNKKETIRNGVSDQLKEALSYSGGEIQIDDSEAVLVHDRNFCPVVTELVNNCLNAGATRVVVTVNKGGIVVEDDVIHTPDELEKILANVRSEKPRTTKRPDPELGFPLGGVGIISVRADLARYEGSLNYEATEDGSIRAKASWHVPS